MAENRVIKFRGMSINGEWCYGLLSVTEKYGTCISNSAGMPFAFQVRPETVSQFTGEPDAAGIDIYEGDVVEEEVETEYGIDKVIHTVEFNAGAFYPICMQPSTTFKILGNKFEHPELLTPKS